MMDDETDGVEGFETSEIDFSETPAFEMPGEEDAVQEAVADSKPDLNIIMDIPVTMQVVLGSAVMPVANLVKLGRGAVVKLDTAIGDPVDLIVNGRIVARGEVVVLENEDSRFGITLTEIVSPGTRPQRPKSLNA
ncbi:flagellar motor switch protein FliN [Aureimonas endophytica]|uniref:Flagellar motor switch protein FliN n=2 Tax=Aureimonas endophytica TaxID=2027858 RepID=A0A917ED34_9HYPH|nr:flagellar motor switch protein FliN [Aureimonas endophytica]